jgi:MerR family transcriptional regulator, light-induced transcriptional regulator
VTAGLSIAAVAQQTGIPVTTLRFYEKELPGLFGVRKTPGGHRRYDDEAIARFAAVRRLTRGGMPLADVRRAVLARAAPAGEAGPSVHAPLVEDLSERLVALEGRVARLETATARRRGWFRRE